MNASDTRLHFLYAQNIMRHCFQNQIKMQAQEEEKSRQRKTNNLVNNCQCLVIQIRNCLFLTITILLFFFCFLGRSEQTQYKKLIKMSEFDMKKFTE